MNDIEILEKLVIYWNSLINYAGSDKTSVVYKWINTEGIVEKRDALRNLIYRVKELENYKRKHTLIKSNYIPKSKIKEKIEDLDLECEKCRFSGQICEEFLTNNQCTIIKCKTILNQLLEEEK